jgi:hypothetical protein
MPLGIFRPLVAEVQRWLPAQKNAKAVARTLFNAWERAHMQPPGIAATVGAIRSLVAVDVTVRYVFYDTAGHRLFKHVVKR